MNLWLIIPWAFVQLAKCNQECPRKNQCILAVYNLESVEEDAGAKVGGVS